MSVWDSWHCTACRSAVALAMAGTPPALLATPVLEASEKSAVTAKISGSAETPEGEDLPDAMAAPEPPIEWRSRRLGQFAAPQPRVASGIGPGDTASGRPLGSAGPFGTLPGQMPSRLKYQYGWATESLVEYRRDRDLNKRVKDNSLVVTPEINAIVVYRPTDWLETTVEVILGKEFPLHEETVVPLPDGTRLVNQRRRASLVIDQMFARVHQITAPFDFTLGRRNYEDERHWIYDTAMDTVTAGWRRGRYRVEALAGREIVADLDLLGVQPHDRINTYMVYGDYRGENAKYAAYSVTRDDRSKSEGRWRINGLRVLGLPSDRVSYWGELAHMDGKDEAGNRLAGYAYDVGVTYRHITMRHLPSITLGYAFGSGDANPGDGKNTEFRQTGLHSNESRFAGISQFKVYGESLDPELSNLRILTLGFGFRPAPSVSVDFVYHRYKLDKIADRLRGSGITAEINQVDGQASKDVGSELDVIVGVRNVFGIRRFGVDLRAGWFRPGHAFLRDDGGGRISRPDRGVAVVAKIWY